MLFLIPVTRVSGSETRSCRTSDSKENEKNPDPQGQSRLFSASLPEAPNPNISDSNTHSASNQGIALDQQSQKSHPTHQRIRSKFNDIEPSTNCPKHKSKKESESELQKKSTRSSLHLDLHPKFILQTQEKSTIQLNPQHQASNSHKFIELEQNLETQADVLPQITYTCKICLQTNNEPTYDSEQNPICKVCRCIDFVHMKCLEAWITRRDIVNQEIDSSQCEVCRGHYEIELKVETFLSMQIFVRYLKNDPKAIFCESIPSLIFLALTIAGCWVLAALIADKDEEGGNLRAFLAMPYTTCITIFVFLEFILTIVFGIFFYSWVRLFMVDYRFRIKPSKGDKIYANRLKKLFNKTR